MKLEAFTKYFLGKHSVAYHRKRASLSVGERGTKVRQKTCEGEKKTVPGRQGQRPEYQEVGSGDRRLSGWRGGGGFSAQGTRVLKHPRLCLSRRTPSRSHGLLTGARDADHNTKRTQHQSKGVEAEWGGKDNRKKAEIIGNTQCFTIL